MSEVAEILLEFWEVAVHTVLYIYELYPRDIFEERRYGSMPVFQSRHPDVNEYVSNWSLRLYSTWWFLYVVGTCVIGHWCGPLQSLGFLYYHPILSTIPLP